MLNRTIEAGLTDVLTREGVGLMAFGPLAGGRLTGKYQAGIPADSRIGHDPRYLKAEMLTPGLHAAIDALAKIADARGDALPVGAAMGAARQGRDFGAHRRKPRGADHRKCRRAVPAAADRRGAGANRRRAGAE